MDCSISRGAFGVGGGAETPPSGERGGGLRIDQGSEGTLSQAIVFHDRFYKIKIYSYHVLPRMVFKIFFYFLLSEISRYFLGLLLWESLFNSCLFFLKATHAVTKEIPNVISSLINRFQNHRTIFEEIVKNCQSEQLLETVCNINITSFQKLFWDAPAAF